MRPKEKPLKNLDGSVLDESAACSFAAGNDPIFGGKLRTRRRKPCSSQSSLGLPRGVLSTAQRESLVLCSCTDSFWVEKQVA